jgi:WD40 repeat protein
LAVSTFRHIELWNVDTGKLIAKFTAAQGRFSQLLAISPDGKTLAGVSNQRDIVLWKVPKLAP